MLEQPVVYLVFRINDEARFAALQYFFANLKAGTRRIASKEKTQETRAVSASDATHATRRLSFQRPDHFLLALRPIDLEVLGLPDHAQSIQALRLWQGKSKRERRDLLAGERRLQVLADFCDMLALFDGLDVQFLTCSKLDSDRARLEFHVPELPYDVARPALEELLMFFGVFSILDERW